MVILGIQKFENPRVGCCGSIRYDSIYPASYDINEFVYEAKTIVANYGTPSFFSENDTYCLEYFLGEPGQEERGKGESLYKLEKNGESWDFYMNGKLHSKIVETSDLDGIAEKCL